MMSEIDKDALGTHEVSDHPDTDTAERQQFSALLKWATYRK